MFDWGWTESRHCMQQSKSYIHTEQFDTYRLNEWLIHIDRSSIGWQIRPLKDTGLEVALFFLLCAVNYLLGTLCQSEVQLSSNKRVRLKKKKKKDLRWLF